MTFSFWNHHFAHEATVEGNVSDVRQHVIGYYRASSKSARVLSESADRTAIRRGSIFMSFCGIGKETWSRHFIGLGFEPIEPHRTKITWSIDMKYCGLTAGKNYLIDECQKLVATLREA